MCNSPTDRATIRHPGHRNRDLLCPRRTAHSGTFCAEGNRLRTKRPRFVTFCTKRYPVHKMSLHTAPTHTTRNPDSPQTDPTTPPAPRRPGPSGRAEELVVITADEVRTGARGVPPAARGRHYPLPSPTHPRRTTPQLETLVCSSYTPQEHETSCAQESARYTR